VSFSSPERLLLLVVPCALLVAYVIMQGMRRRYAVRFTSVDLLASVAPKRPGWQRHISAALLLMAMLLLVFGFAEPNKKVKVPKQEGTVLVAIDTSGSMSANDVAPTRLEAAKAAATQFVNRLPAGLKVGLLAFDTNARLIVAPTSDRPTAVAAINGLQVGGGTDTGDAILRSLDAINGVPKAANGKVPGAAIVLMSDGTPTIGRDGMGAVQTVESGIAAAKQAKVPVDTIAFGTPNGTIERQGEVIPVPADPQSMQEIASGTGGKSFTAKTANQLTSVYDQIRKSVGYDTKTRDISFWFSGLGLLLAALTAGAALIWTQRIP
jgi:Ca-activated chloride channel homolog